MKCTKLLLTTLLIICASVAADAQQTLAHACTLKVENAPELRGLRLGMTLEQARSRLPNLQVKPGQFGMTTASLDQSSMSGARPAGFEGVGWLNLEFVDERMTRITVGYSNSINWQSSAQFAARVADALKLPDAWVNDMSMECDGFNVYVHPNTIVLSATQPYRIMQQRRAEQEEKERQSFRP